MLQFREVSRTRTIYSTETHTIKRLYTKYVVKWDASAFFYIFFFPGPSPTTVLASKWVKVSFYFLRMQPLCGVTSPISGVSTLSWRKKERKKEETKWWHWHFRFYLRCLLTSTGFFNTSPTFSHSLRSKSAGISLSCRFVFRYITGILLINIKANADTCISCAQNVATKNECVYFDTVTGSRTKEMRC